MKLRPGRKNPRNLYLQFGPEPGNDDPCIGFLVDPGTAQLIGESLLSVEHLERIRMNVDRRSVR